ncbi:MAG: DUF6867 family protein [Flavobacteriaceae bacterium]
MGIFWEESSIWLFLLVTVILGGGAAMLTGRAMAATWRPFWMAVLYMFLLGAAVRFLHFSLFDGTLLTLQYYLVDTLVLIVASAIGFRLVRANQMATQYSWIYERSGPFGWRRKAD